MIDNPLDLSEQTTMIGCDDGNNRQKWHSKMGVSSEQGNVCPEKKR
jgi:hypothetical protein